MKRASMLLLMIALAAMVSTSLPGPSHAGRFESARSTGVLAATPGGPTTESWWGAGAAIGCGFGIRYGSALGGWGVAATAILCLIALADAV
jgi:hypothetical protein